MISASIPNPRTPRRDWSRARRALPTAKRRRGGSEASSPDPILARATQQQQVVLDATSALAYAKEHLPHLFEADEDAVAAQPLSDGVINSVFAIGRGSGGDESGSGSGASVVLKQALPHVRAVGPSFPLSRARMDAEATAMELAERAVAAAATADAAEATPLPIARPPPLLHFGREQSVLVCARVPQPPFSPLYDALVTGQLPAGTVAAPLFRLLARLQRPPTTEGGDPANNAALASSLQNEDMVRANLDVVLRQPFGLTSDDEAAAVDAAIASAPPHLRADGEWLLLFEPAVRRAASALDFHYARSAQRSSRRFDGLAFAFNDLHPGNVFVATVPAEQWAAALFAAAEAGAAGAGAAAPSTTEQQPTTTPAPYLIDWEFAAPGPAAFDVGTLGGNLLVAALALPRVPLSSGERGAAVRSAQRGWLLAEAAGLWRAHQEAVREVRTDDDQQKDDDEEEDERWAVAWAGAAIIRQVLGLHRHPLLRLASAGSPSEVEALERSCLALGRAMLLAAPSSVGGGGEEAAPAPGAVASFGAAAAVALELARALDDLHG